MQHQRVKFKTGLPRIKIMFPNGMTWTLVSVSFHKKKKKNPISVLVKYKAYDMTVSSKVTVLAMI